MHNRFFGNIHSKPTQKVGFVVKTLGFKGVIKVAVYSDEIFDNITQSGFLLLNREGRWVPYKIESYNIENDSIKLTDLNNEAEAQAICGLEIHLHKSEMDNLSEDSFNFLIGFTMFNQDNHKIGIITDLIQMHLSSLLEVRMEEKNILVPIHESLIINIDEASKSLTLTMHEGLTEL
ncbi:MAG: ribosome maturation factor RimM [Bacteroidia bacterium]|nr:ribosome maturation factor RimM [Bacteroidia bacterium]